MLSEEAKARQKEAKKLWYEKNKDYKNPNPDKVSETSRKASLKYYYKNKSEINSKNQKIYKDKVKAKRAERIAQTLKVHDPEILYTDFSVLPKRINLPFKTVWGDPPIKVEGGFFPLS
jgi:hypothetical protein